MMVLFHFGYAKPVPVNMWKFRNPKRGMAITALAGPASNFIIAVVFLFLSGFLAPLLYLQGGARHYLFQMILLTAQLSLMLGLFNLIPIPPLDGSKVLFSFLSDEGYAKLMRYERYGFLLMAALLLLGAFNGVLVKAENAVLGWLTPVFELGVELGLQVF
jgi:Zn-dependent protease